MSGLKLRRNLAKSSIKHAPSILNESKTLLFLAFLCPSKKSLLRSIAEYSPRASSAQFTVSKFQPEHIEISVDAAKSSFLP